MNICSIGFLVLCGAATLVFHWIKGRRRRQIFLGALNLAFVGTFIPNAASGVTLVVFLLATYLAVRLARTRPPLWAFILILTVAVGMFLVLKKYSFLEPVLPAEYWRHPLELVGISYMLFKFIHVFVDAWQGQLQGFSLERYANYQLAFFTLVAGPIQRYNNFEKYWESMDLGTGDSCRVLRAWDRILTGLIKMSVLATPASAAFERALVYVPPMSTSRALLVLLTLLYAYPIYLYFNFSGYTDIMIGAAALLGFELLENFNRPYLARNVIDFWNRWHITLTHWIRDYVFMTSYKVVAERFAWSARWIGYGLLFLSLVLAGVWHGSTANFAAFGVVHGLGAAVNRIYGDCLQSLLGRPAFQRFQKNTWVRAVDVFLNLHYVCFSFLFFSNSMSRAADCFRIVAGRVL